MAVHSRHTLVAALLATAMAITLRPQPSAAQGMDINALNAEMNARMNAQMMQQQQQIVAQVMQLPHFQQMYQQYRMQGGQMPPQQYALEYAARGRFTAQGMQNFQNSRSQMEDQQRQGMQGLREAEAARGQAQMGYSQGYQRNNQEFGNQLQGNSTYLAPNGQQFVLPHTQPGVPQRDASGNTFVMDNRGQYFIHTPYGWQPMRPAF